MIAFFTFLKWINRFEKLFAFFTFLKQINRSLAFVVAITSRANYFTCEKLPCKVNLYDTKLCFVICHHASKRTHFIYYEG
jgi:hypothetical protein